MNLVPTGFTSKYHLRFYLIFESKNESKLFLARFDHISIVDFIFLGFIFIFLPVFSKIRIENGIFIQIVAQNMNAVRTLGTRHP